LHFSLALIAPLLFGILVCFAVFRVIRFARQIRAVVSDGALGKTIHLDTPAGAVDIKPRTGRDPVLAALPLYPGSLPFEPEKPGYDTSFNLFGRGLQLTAEKYWTADGAGAVRDFFERNLPGWQWDRHYDASGDRLRHDEGETILAITIRREDGRTIIEPAVSRKTSSNGSLGPVISSDSTYGVLR
jgi:hypothetical protein